MNNEGQPAGSNSLQIVVDDEGKSFTLEYSGDQLVRIGRSPECDIVLTTSKSSRVHAEIFGESGCYTLLDKKSANGTYLNGEKVTSSPLAPGDEIRIGQARIQFGQLPVGAAAAPSESSSAAESEDDGGDGAAAARTRRPEPMRKRPSPVVRGLQVALPLVLISVLGYAIWRIVETEASKQESPSAPASTASQSAPNGFGGLAGVGVPGATDSGPGTGSLVPDSTGFPPPGTSPDTPWPGVDSPDALDAIATVQEEARSGEFGWEFLLRLEEVQSTFPGTRAAAQAHRWSQLLDGVRRGVGAQGRGEAELRLGTLVADEHYAEALAVTRFLGSVDRDEQGYWKEREQEIVAVAQSRFARLEKSLGDLLVAGSARDALRALLEARVKFAGTSFYEELLPRYIEASIGEASVVPTVAGRRDSTIDRLRAQAARAFDELRFQDLSPIYYQLLGRNPGFESRIVALRGLVEAFYLERLFESFLAGASGQELDVDLVDGYSSRVVRVSDKEVEVEIDLEGHSYRETRPWTRVGPVQKYNLFRAVPLERDAVLGLAYFAFRVGHEEGAHRALIRLNKRKESRDLVHAVLAERRGIAIPDEGFVVHRGRLLTPAERDADVARRKLRREQGRSALAELKRLKKEDRLSAWIEQALALRRESSFEAAQNILIQLATRFPDTEAGVEARRIVDNPYLASHELVIHGPPENRLDIVFLGDGYPVEDDYQEAFLNQVNTCKALFLNEEPFKEYQSYLNLYAVQLGSKDTGLDRVPGGDPKDTALGGKVEWDRITMDPALVHGLLRQVFGENNDGLAICLGNDTAGVATGGGGVVSLAKGNVGPVGHEVGHALGALLDEYDFEPGNDPDRPIPKGRKANVPTEAYPPNVMGGSNREEILAEAVWGYWIEAGESQWWNRSKVSVFEGANRTPFNMWRPQIDCKMRNAGSNFCVVCMEVMVRSIYRYVDPIDESDPEPGELTVKPNGRLLVKVFPMKPETHYLEAKWYLRDLGVNDPTPASDEDEDEEEDVEAGSTGVAKKRTAPKGDDPGQIYRRVYRTLTPEGRVVECAEIQARDLKEGYYRLTVTISDPTEWVIRDEEKLLQQTQEWIIRVVE